MTNDGLGTKLAGAQAILAMHTPLAYSRAVILFETPVFTRRIK